MAWRAADQAGRDAAASMVIYITYIYIHILYSCSETCAFASRIYFPFSKKAKYLFRKYDIFVRKYNF